MDKQTSSIESNIWKLIVLQIGFATFALSFASVVPYLNCAGMSNRWVIITRALIGLVCALTQLPTGIIADTIGRKRSIVLCGALITVGAIPYVLKAGILWLLVGDILSVVGIAFHTGADIAMLYDSLVRLGREEEYSVILGRLQGVRIAAVSGFTLLGGLLGAIALPTPWIAITVISSAVIPLGLLLYEEDIPSMESSSLSLLTRISSLWQGWVSACDTLFHQLQSSLQNSRIRWVILFRTFIFGSTQAGIYAFQPYLVNLGLSTTTSGVVYFLSGAVAAIAALFAFKVEPQVHQRTLAVCMVAGMGFGSLALGLVHSIPILLFVIPQQLAFGFVGVVYSQYLNTLIDHEERATINSFQAMTTQLLASVAVLGFGGLALLFNGSLFACMGVFVLCCALIILKLFVPPMVETSS